MVIYIAVTFFTFFAETDFHVTFDTEYIVFTVFVNLACDVAQIGSEKILTLCSLILYVFICKIRVVNETTVWQIRRLSRAERSKFIHIVIAMFEQ